jgi:apolipoprotein N-acyltransferase
MSRTSSLTPRWIAALLGGGLVALSSTLHPVWWAAWVGSAAVLWAAFGSRARVGAGLALAAGVIGGIPFALYLLDVAPMAVVLGATLVNGLAYALGVALAAAVRRRVSPAIAVFAFPAWCAALETLRALTSPHGTASSLAYSQMEFTPVLQVASLGGAPAVTFVVMLFASALAFVAADGARSRTARAAAVPALAVVVASLGFGAWRLAAAPAASSTTVALAAFDLPRPLPSDWRAVLAAYRPRVQEAGDRGARLVVLPEEIARVSVDDLPALQSQLSEWSKAMHTTLVAGFRVGPDGAARNRLLAVGPDGGVASYDKRHLIPGLESRAVAASDNPVLIARAAGLKLGGSICKDFDFVDTGRALAAGGAQVVAAPAWDFGEDGWLHGRMAVLRGVEGGFTLVRAARNGMLTVSDRDGRVLAEGRSGPAAPLLVTQAPVPGDTSTLYARVGDVFGDACVVAVLAFLASLFLPRRDPGAARAAQGGATDSA